MNKAAVALLALGLLQMGGDLLEQVGLRSVVRFRWPDAVSVQRNVTRNR